MDIPIIYEDESILVLDKPSEIHSVRNPKNNNASIAGWLIDNNPLQEGVSINSNDGGLVNRLDYETSGVILAAKTRDDWQELRIQFSQDSIKKEYAAIVEGETQDCHNIENYIGSPYRRAKKVKVYEKEPRKDRTQIAITNITPKAYNKDTDSTLLHIEILTGVRHQIRAHCSHMGYPILGDALYGSQRQYIEMKKEKRPFFLHSSSISLRHPKTKKLLVFESKTEYD